MSRLDSVSPTIVTIAQASAEHPRHSEAAVVEQRDGSLLIAWQEYFASERMGEDNAPNRIATMHSEDGGLSWRDHAVLIETSPGAVNVYSPSFVRLNNGDLLFIYFQYDTIGEGIAPRTTCYVKTSGDDGRTFSPLSLAWRDKPDGCASSTAKLLSSDRIILPVARQTGRDWSPTDHSIAGCVFSDDDGVTWRESDQWVDLPLRGAMEPHVVELADGRLLMMMRTQLGALFGSHSADGGQTWSKPQTTGLRSPESCPEIVRIPGRRDLLIAWNNSPYDPAWASHYGRRSPLSVAISRDNAITWNRAKDIVSDPNRAYSNPAITITSRGSAILTYWDLAYAPDGRMMIDRTDLKAAIFDVRWLGT